MEPISSLQAEEARLRSKLAGIAGALAVPGRPDVCAVHEQGHAIYGRNAGSVGTAVQDAAWRMQQEGRS